jgi:membrane associated rhomboid family serine protease
VLVLKRIPVVLAAVWVIGAFILFQIVMAATDDGSSGVGWFAHLGGLAAGAVLLPLLKRPDVELFDGGR